ncbi:MAG: hypothetical protein Q8N83_08910 [Ignavibacteria bacterium]|nr:hypothetical protein [Ignavibacteria bacterium]
MDAYKNITSREIEAKLNDGDMRGNRIISLAMLGGSFFFLLIIIILSQKNASVETATRMVGDPNIFLIVFIALGFIVYSMFMVFPKIFLKKENLMKLLSATNEDGDQNNIVDPVTKIIGIDRTLMIIRLAQLEGITLFGLVILMMNVSEKNIFENPTNWIFLLPLFFQLIYVLNNCITTEKTVARIEANILSAIKNM